MNKESLIRQLNIVKNGFNKSIDIVIKELEKSKDRDREKEKEKDRDIPLSLEQMREMIENSGEDIIGNHVWVVDEYNNKIAAILDYCTEYGICAIYSVDDIIFTENNYGTKWLAYRV